MIHTLNFDNFVYMRRDENIFIIATFVHFPFFIRKPKSATAA